MDIHVTSFGVFACILKNTKTKSRFFFFMLKVSNCPLMCSNDPLCLECYTQVDMLFSFGKSQFLCIWFDSYYLESYHMIFLLSTLPFWINKCIVKSYHTWFDSNIFLFVSLFLSDFGFFVLVIWFTWLVNHINLHLGQLKLI